MCGIALILSGIRIVRPDLDGDSSVASSPDPNEVYQPCALVENLKAALHRRGPDNLGRRKVFLGLEDDSFLHNSEEQGESMGSPFDNNGKYRVTTQDAGVVGFKDVAELDFFGATLQLRGSTPVFQPLVDDYGNILIYNGEIFGGIHVADDKNDAETLLHALQGCCSCGQESSCACLQQGVKSVPEILSTIKGPWALIYWQERSKTIWFGRDVFGRRSLLVHWSTLHDPRFVLSSVLPPSFVRRDLGSALANGDLKSHADYEAADEDHDLCNWEELPCGTYSVDLNSLKDHKWGLNNRLFRAVKRHQWFDPMLNKLIKWERAFVDPKLENTSPHNMLVSGCVRAAHNVLSALRESVARRTCRPTNCQTFSHMVREEAVPVAVLFSGGLDSMIIAALLDQCLDSKCIIDLLNVSFDHHLAPDRLSARAGIQELKKIAPCRRWRLVEIDASLSDLSWETEHLTSLIYPAKTYMDLNIGIALWLAAGGDGWVDGEVCDHEGNCGRYRYKSTARILLVGSGADEQCAGYGRHRTKYRLGGWAALQDEMRLDMQRIWKRNLGRDDRCISDHGKEARFPFLDEDVIDTLLEIPLWEIARLDEPVGQGDKKILREVAKLLGMEEAAVMPKRAIQFGSRIARESNKKNFGSNRAANQASAGSVEIKEPMKQLH